MTPALLVKRNGRWQIGNYITCDRCGGRIFFEWPQNPRGHCPQCGKYTTVLLKEKA